MRAEKFPGIMRCGLRVAARMVLAGCASGPASRGPKMGGEAATAKNVANYKQIQHLVAQAREAGLNGVYALVRGGETSYCWRQHIVGSNIPRTDCVNHAGQLRSLLRAMARQRHLIEEAPQGGCLDTKGMCNAPPYGGP